MRHETIFGKMIWYDEFFCFTYNVQLFIKINCNWFRKRM